MGASNFLRKLIGGGGRSGIDRRTEDLISLCSALLAESGEYTSTALARDALAAYQALDERTRAEFFDVLARDYGVPVQLVSRAAASYQADPSVENLMRLQQAVDSPRREFFRRLNMAPGGTAALVDMRSEVLKGVRAHAHWKVIDADLRHLLRSWFNRGFLRLERIDWHTSAMVLERLIDYEAVHAIRGWWDLRRRLEHDRRCFAFFHPQLPDEPAWHLGEVPEDLQKLLLRLCSYYLLRAKQGAEPLDAVARFHLGNGAALERLNWMGDTSEQGMARSAGLMVNYVYWLAEVERNHERYFREHHIVASPLVEKLARECPLGAQAEKSAAA